MFCVFLHAGVWVWRFSLMHFDASLSSTAALKWLLFHLGAERTNFQSRVCCQAWLNKSPSAASTTVPLEVTRPESLWQSGHDLKEFWRWLCSSLCSLNLALDGLPCFFWVWLHCVFYPARPCLTFGRLFHTLLCFSNNSSRSDYWSRFLAWGRWGAQAEHEVLVYHEWQKPARYGLIKISGAN